MVESANAAILGVTWRASTGNYTSDDKSLVSLAHIDERRIKRNVRKNRHNYYLDVPSRKKAIDTFQPIRKTPCVWTVWCV
jgi:hypothetical protein